MKIIEYKDERTPTGRRLHLASIWTGKVIITDAEQT